MVNYSQSVLGESDRHSHSQWSTTLSLYWVSQTDTVTPNGQLLSVCIGWVRQTQSLPWSTTLSLYWVSQTDIVTPMVNYSQSVLGESDRHSHSQWSTTLSLYWVSQTNIVTPNGQLLSVCIGWVRQTQSLLMINYSQSVLGESDRHSHSQWSTTLSLYWVSQTQSLPMVNYSQSVLGESDRHSHS